MRATNTLTLGTDRALYVGELPATGWHRHAAPVLLLGLSGRFAVHLAPGRVETCHSALIDMGVWHLFDPCGERVALVYLEPDSAEARSLRQYNVVEQDLYTRTVRVTQPAAVGVPVTELFRRHNSAEASLNPELREEASVMLDAIVVCRQKYVDKA